VPIDPGRPTAVVIGGGIAGLAAAWELSHAGPAGPRVVVFEDRSFPGGKLRREAFGGRIVDLGPDAFVARRPEALGLCTELGLAPELIAPATSRAFLWARGALRPLPPGLALGVPTRLRPLARSGICSPGGLARAALDLVRPGFVGAAPKPGADRAVGDVVRRRLGDEVARRLADPLIGGIHAGPIDTMSSAAVFPALLEADRRPGSLMRGLRGAAPLPGSTSAPVFLSLRGGLARLADELAAGLERRGVEMRVGEPVVDLRRASPTGAGAWVVASDATVVEADGIVVATPAPEAARLLGACDRGLGEDLAAIAYSSVAILTLRFDAPSIGRRLDGSGFLVPRDLGRSGGPLLTACTWLTAKWPELARPGDVVLRVSVGRHGDDRHRSLTDDALVRSCVEELGPILDVRGPPLEVRVTRWTDAFPQYNVGHLDRVAALENAVDRLPTAALAGAALHGVGIPACIGSGRRAARSVLTAIAPS
jgi:protoporphyrinogen/coproporphyrinogen III oxidase